MSELRLGSRPEDFIWAGGIEDTFIPQARNGMRPLEEYELLGHYEHWREDLALAAAAGMRALRWGIPWYRVEPAPGEFDWRWTDQVIPYMVEELGITPILDLMHYGCPLWLEGAFDNPGYPDAVAAYAGAVAQRYGRLIRWYTPFNEPFISAVNSGRIGVWPPYMRGQRGQFRIMLQIVKGIRSTMAAVRAAVPDALMVHVEATGITRAARPDLQVLAVEDRNRRCMSLDLLTGRVTPEHPLFPALVRNGIKPDDLAAFVADPVSLDVLGLNFYPQWSTKAVGINRSGRLSYRIVERGGEGFAGLIREYYGRYGVPLIISETSAHPPEAARLAWVDESLAAIKAVRAEGVPLYGYTWFPLFTMIAWRYRFGRLPLDAYRLELGLYVLGPSEAPRWLPTPTLERFREHVAHTAESVGEFGVPGAS